MRKNILSVSVLLAGMFAVLLPLTTLALDTWGRPPVMTASVSPSPADKTLTVNVQGALSQEIERCSINGDGLAPFVNKIVGGAYAVVGNAVDVISGPLQGQKIPTQIVSEARDGGCESGGRPASFQGSHTFDVSGLANGTYLLALKVTDDFGGSDTVELTFSVLHPAAPPPPSDFTVSCSVNPEAEVVGKPVAWSAQVSGSGATTYTWSGSDGLSGTSASVTKTYATPGGKDGTVSVKRGGVTKQATCTVFIGGNMPTHPECSPHNQNAKVGEQVSFSVSGGFAPYSWKSNFGNPSAGTGPTFTTAISEPGLRSAKVLDQFDNHSWCFVQVSSCSTPSKITVTSKKADGTPLPTTWALTGPTPQVQSAPATQATYDNQSFGGPYTLSPGILANYQAQVNPAGSQTITTCGATLNFDIVYTCTVAGGCGGGPGGPGPGSPTLRVEPTSAEIQVGGDAHFNSKYDPDGTGPLAEHDATFGSGWSSSNPGKAGFGGFSGGAALFHGNAAGTANVTAAYMGLTAGANLNVVAGPGSSLTASLQANPNQGKVILTTNLTATAGGSATGPLSYTFFKSCGYTGTDVGAAIVQCGAPLGHFSNIGDNPKITSAQYPVAGNFTALVIIERGGFAARATAGVSAQEDDDPPPGSTHKECVNSACTLVSGSGPDRCNVNADCGGGGGGPGPGPTHHSACDQAQKACVNVAGPRPPGVLACSSDPNCTGTTPSHLECQNQNCVIVGGAGTNTCSSVGSGCTTAPPGGGGTCTFTATPQVITKGGSSALNWSCSGGITTCSIRDTGTSQLMNPNGPSGAAGTISVSPQITTIYALNCSSGAFTTSTTVRVLLLREIPPQ